MCRAIFLLILINSGICSANEGFEGSPTQQTLLKKANQLERQAPWQAAKLYCTGARAGLIEAQYRLAMLFAFGQGVPEDREVAASLLAMAAQQGHLEASNMLETIRYSSDKLPGCVLTDTDPPHAPHSIQAFGIQNETLSTRLASLPKSRRWLIDMIKSIAQWHDVDPLLALSIVSVESNFQTHAQSNAHAMGLMQLIPATAERFNVKDAFDASQNVKGGVRYLRWLLNRYHGKIELVAAAYNAGEGAVDKYKGVPPYKETRDYVKRVLQHYPQPS
ncbi:MAG: transglycosylase SLT domain-containing protein [Methylococcaceae bacterium]|nr:transglycosylase SLT domain-containing protein [Methylococcaceae bacterium]